MTDIADVTITFLGLTPGAEILGATQADFTLGREGANAREVALLLNTPAAKFLAEHLGVEDSPEFRNHAAETVGKAWLRQLAAKGGRLDSITFLSKSALEADPEFLASLKG